MRNGLFSRCRRQENGLFIMWKKEVNLKGILRKVSDEKVMDNFHLYHLNFMIIFTLFYKF